jgi:nucleoside-diphosphate-sugar epimerase
VTTLVVGAGYVGGALASVLAARGETVFALRRSTSSLEGVTGIAADVHAPDLALPSSITRLVYAVGAGASTEDAYRRAYPAGLGAVLDALERAGARLERGIFTSSTAVYAQDDGERVDESSPVSAVGNARFLLEAESVLASRLDARAIVLRLAGIYGPGRERLIRMVREGSARCSHPPPIGNRIHQSDCAGALAHLLSLASPSPLYVGVDEAPVELCDVYRWMAKELGVAAPPATSDTPDERGRGARKRVDSTLLRRSGYAFRYPTFREGYGELIEAARIRAAP